MPPTSIAMTDDQFAALLERFTAAQQTSGSAELTAAIDAIRAMAQAQVLATTELGAQVKRTARHSNSDHEHVSAFNYKSGCPYCEAKTRHPESDLVDSGKLGHPKPPLRYEVFWPKGVKVLAEDVTVFEAELLNQFETDKTARDETWTATFSRDHKQLQINVPCYFPDDRGNLPPSFAQILMELLYGADVVNPELTSAMIASLQQRITDLEATARPSAAVGA